MGPWLMGGDFSVTRFFGVRIESQIHLQGMKNFNETTRPKRYNAFTQKTKTFM